MEDEREDLLEQLARQDSALSQLRQEIRDAKKARDEFKEAVGQLQRRGQFLAQTSPKNLIQLEVESLRRQIQQLDKDVQALTDLEVAEPEQEQEVEDDGEEVGQLIRGLDDLILDIAKAKAENESIRSDIDQLKSKTSDMNSKLVDRSAIDLIQMLDESRLLKQKLDAETKATRSLLKEAKRSKRKARQSNQALGLEQMERPLKMLRQNKRLSQECSSYLKHLSLALLEALKLKEKMVANSTRGNETLAKRLSSLTGESPETFYDPKDQPDQDSFKLNTQNPVV